MSASFDRAALARIALRDILLALFCFVFACVYEQFSHGVWSAAMVFAGVGPLLAALPFLMAAAARRPWPIALAAVVLWHAAWAAFTVGGLMAGALEIYGTAHPLLIVYPIAGGLLCVAAAVCQAMAWAGEKRSTAK